MIKRQLITCFLTFTLTVFTNLGPLNAEITSKKAEDFISGLANQAIQALTLPKISRKNREKHFRVLLNENFAVKTIGRWMIGRHWSRATKKERKEFLKLFENLLVINYVNRFSNYAGEKLVVVKSSVIGAKEAIVFSEIVRQGAEPIKVDWQVYSGDSINFKIVDVKVEGVSMGQTQKSEFSSVIRQNGGKIEGLLAILRKRVS